MPYNFLKLIQSNSHIGSFNNFAFYPVSTKSEEEEEPDYPATTSLVYTLSNDGTYYIVGTGFTSIEAIEADTSGGTNGSGLDSTWTGGQLVIPAEYNGLPVKAIAPRALGNTTNITELYIYDGITTIGHRAFQCAPDFSNGFDTTMKSCRLPETLTSLGGKTSSGAGRVFWGRKGLGEYTLVIPNGVTYFSASTFAHTVIDNLNINNGSFNTHCFQYAKINNLIIGNDDAVGSFAYYSFYFANIGTLSVVGTYGFKTASGASDKSTIYGCTINEMYTDERCTFDMISFGGESSDLTTINSGHINCTHTNIEYRFININPTTNYKDSQLDLTISGGAIRNASSAFNNSTFRNVVIENTGWYSYDENTFVMSFRGKMQSMNFKNLQSFNTWRSDDTIVSTIDRLYFPALTTTGNRLFNTSAVIGKIFFGYSNCTLGSLDANILTKHCYFKPEYIDNYSQGTNWSTFFVKDGNEEPQMFVYNSYSSGDALPSQIGTTQFFNVVWYEDDNFTTLAGATATADKDYFGKITAVV